LRYIGLTHRFFCAYHTFLRPCIIRATEKKRHCPIYIYTNIHIYILYTEIYRVHPFYFFAQVTHSVGRASYARQRRSGIVRYVERTKATSASASTFSRAPPVKRLTDHTHTQTPIENTTSKTDAYAHDKNNPPTPQTNTSYTHLTMLEGGATTVRRL